MEYCILNRVLNDELETVVNSYIRNGWTPLGGVSSGRDGLYQAMTRTSHTRWSIMPTSPDTETTAVPLNETVKVDFR